MIAAVLFFVAAVVSVLLGWRRALVVLAAGWVFGVGFILFVADPPQSCPWPFLFYAATWPIWGILPDWMLLRSVLWSMSFCRGAS